MIIYIDNKEFWSIEEVSEHVKEKAGNINLKCRFGGFPAPIKLPCLRFWDSEVIKEYQKQKMKKEF